MLIYLNSFLILHDLFVALFIFFNSFLIFRLWLNFLVVSQPFVSKKIFLLNTQELLNEFFENSFLVLRKELLIKYKFLRKFSLPYPYINKKTVIRLDIERDEPFVDSFSKYEREFLNGICHEIYFNWYMPNVLNGKINLATLSFNPDRL